MGIVYWADRIGMPSYHLGEMALRIGVTPVAEEAITSIVNGEVARCI